MSIILKEKDFQKRETEITNTYRQAFINIKQDEIDQNKTIRVGDYNIEKNNGYNIILTGIKIESFNQLAEAIYFIQGWE